MKSNYKKLGPYIQVISERNKNLRINNLIGLSIQKMFIPSISNTIGTDMSTYRIIRKNQFAYCPVTSRNGNKITVALSEEYEEAIISQAYTVFEIINHDELLPEYLMMWFRRPEFDRYARYMSHGSVREIFGWEEMCNVELPVPDIEKQKAVVKEYNTIVNRIKLNEKLNQKLEETAQAIYKQWFVDFEFPMSKENAKSIGKPELKGKAYKANGGEMIWNEVLGKDVPIGWGVRPLKDYCDITFSKRIFYSEYLNKGVPFYRSKEIILKKGGKPIGNELYISNHRYREIVSRFGGIMKGDILLTAVGTIGISYRVRNEEFYFKDGNLFWFRNFSKNSYRAFIYEWMQNDFFKNMLEEITFGSTQKVITTTALYKETLLCPPDKIVEHFAISVMSLHEKVNIQNVISQKLFVFKDLLLSKMIKS